VPYILRDTEHDNGLCYEFFQEALSRFDEDDTIEPLFTKAMVDISSQLSKLSMNDGYKPYMTVCKLAWDVTLEELNANNSRL
jgi:ubiquitin conjugation factor E4 B